MGAKILKFVPRQTNLVVEPSPEEIARALREAFTTSQIDAMRRDLESDEVSDDLGGE